MFRPKLFEWLYVVRQFLLLWVAGDDTGRAGVHLQDIITWQTGIDQICHNAHVTHTKGLGLVIKAPKIDYKRIGILSKVFCMYKGKAIVLRQISRLILTNTTASMSVSNS